jgi:hypothetical protein
LQRQRKRTKQSNIHKPAQLFVALARLPRPSSISCCRLPLSSRNI